jgi:hypothetical protein
VCVCVRVCGCAGVRVCGCAGVRVCGYDVGLGATKRIRHNRIPAVKGAIVVLAALNGSKKIGDDVYWKDAHGTWGDRKTWWTRFHNPTTLFLVRVGDLETCSSAPAFPISLSISTGLAEESDDSDCRMIRTVK